MDIKQIFKHFENDNFFIKTTAGPAIGSEEKAHLNRKGNVLYNSGDIEGARRIFLTTKYTDGLVRIGDHYQSIGRPMDALRMYWIAPDRKKAEPVLYRLSILLKDLIKEEANYE